MSVLIFDHVDFSWDDGTQALHDICAVFSHGRTGLIGRNGSGKSTLLRLAAGELPVQSGTITAGGDIAYLPQNLTLEAARPVTDLLGVSRPMVALRSIEAGDADPKHFEILNDDWDVEARALAALEEIGIDGGCLMRTVGQLSGGETMLAALAGIRMQRPRITLLDEPTNNLDRDARVRLYAMIESWPDSLIIASHDTQLLELMDQTAELYEHRLTVFGGPYSQWREWIDAEQSAAVQAERDAQKAVKKEQRQRIEAETKLARRQRYARSDYQNLRRPRMVMKLRAREAQVSAGKLRGQTRQSESAARSVLAAAEKRVRDDDSIRIDVPDPGLAASRRVARLSDGSRSWIIQGPERVALTGPNGSGKTMLLQRMLGDDPTAYSSNVAGQLHVDQVGYLPQRIDGLAEHRSVLDNLRHNFKTGLTDDQLRHALARFHIRGTSVTHAVRSLSGGERFRVALAGLLLAEPPPQLLIMDEPANNLDIDTTEQLIAALRAYRGALLLVSHDEDLLARLDLDFVLELRDDQLSERTGMF